MDAIFEEKKLELRYDNLGEDKPRKQTLNNVKQKATNDDLAAFGKLMGDLAPADEAINALIIVEKQRIDL